MITKFKLFEDFMEDEWGEIRVVAIANCFEIEKGHTYIIDKFLDNGRLKLRDAVNNMVLYGHENSFISENDYKYPEIKKYNL